jgi:hypothetical protein
MSSNGKEQKPPDFYKRVTGRNFDADYHIPSFEDILNKDAKRSKSEYPLRLLGSGSKELWITEEEREANMHIIGQPRQGKSKFIEYQIRQDIDMGNGLCLLDPSENGDTCKKVLRYCALKGIKKVIYIDPDLCFRLNRIPTIQPIKPPPYREQSIDAILESVNALFGVVNQTDTNRVKRNLTAILNILAQKNLTLYETKYFRNYVDPRQLPFMDFDEDSLIIKDGFNNRTHFNQYFITTVGRLDTFRGNPLKLMTASDKGIDFEKMVKEGWVILVNLSPNRSLPKTQARLLGILIISEIVQAMSALFHYKPEGVVKKIFYLYMDEAARFATLQIADLLDYFGKIGLRLVIAHHDFYQFRKFGQEAALNAIKNGCRIKMMFNISSYKDRLEMVEDLGYGGDLHPLLASYANQNIPKREMVIKKDKETPVRIRVPDVPDITTEQVSDEQLDEYIKEILSQPFYLSKEEIHRQIDVRQIRTNIPTSPLREVDDRETDNESNVPAGILARKQQQSLSEGDEKPKNPPRRKTLKI